MGKRYVSQARKILLKKNLEIRHNSEWYKKMRTDEFLNIASRFTIDQLLEREMFIRRREVGDPVYVHEFLYPLLQGYDSVMLKSDLTIVGTDQIFNEVRGRDLQRFYGQEPQDIIATKLLIGVDGERKMSQSLGNDIRFGDSPKEMFGKVMSLPDKLVVHYFTLVTLIPLAEVAGLEKEITRGAITFLEAKKRLGEELVTLYHSAASAKAAREEFERVFSKKEAPKDVQKIGVPYASAPLLTIVSDSGLVSSNTEAKRLIAGGAVEVDGKKVLDASQEILVDTSLTLRVGKHRFVRIVRY
jgi:tyrosyl-tRNA synthetase